MLDEKTRTDGRPAPADPGHASAFAPSARIVAVQGASGDAIQALLTRLAARWTADGLRVAGAIEASADGARKGSGGTYLRNLGTGTAYAIYQDLGPHSTACCLDGRGFAEACQHVVDDMAACDVVVLSKFGKLEAERGGLLSAFAAAALLDKPVITAVSPTFNAGYRAFVGHYGTVVPPDEEDLYAWGCGFRSR